MKNAQIITDLAGGLDAPATCPFASAACHKEASVRQTGPALKRAGIQGPAGTFSHNRVSTSRGSSRPCPCGPRSGPAFPGGQHGGRCYQPRRVTPTSMAR